MIAIDGAKSAAGFLARGMPRAVAWKPMIQVHSLASIRSLGPPSLASCCAGGRSPAVGLQGLGAKLSTLRAGRAFAA